MRAFAVLAIAAFVLAGCSGGGNESTSTSGPTHVTEGTTTSRGGGSGENHPPTGSIAASVVAGDAPLRVNFTLDGTDQDNDPLSWTMDANGDQGADAHGDTLPATANYTYESPGDFNVTYTISDGKSEVSFHVLISVKSNAPPAEPFEPVSFMATLPLECSQCDQTTDASACVSWVQHQPGVDCTWTEIKPNAAGHKWLATGTVDVGVMFYETCDASAAIVQFTDPNFTEPEEGTVPAGALCVLLFGAEAPGQTLQIDIT